MMDAIEFTHGKWKLSWEHIGEGFRGDYDEDDRDDIPLLRADLTFDGKELQDSSYCTLFPSDSSKEILQAASQKLFNELPAEVTDWDQNGGHWNDKIMQEWTWTRPKDVANG
jgi:hypothetical protein